MSATEEAPLLRKPLASDGYAIHQLIAQSPPLDLNSIYSYYLLSDHFRDSCVVAESEGAIVGFLSAYRIPQAPQRLFVWQVVVAAGQRGRGLAARMLDELLARPWAGEVCFVEATVNPSNCASRRLFERLAEKLGSALEEETFLEAAAFGPGAAHESEILLRVPLRAQSNQ